MNYDQLCEATRLALNLFQVGANYVCYQTDGEAGYYQVNDHYEWLYLGESI